MIINIEDIKKQGITGDAKGFYKKSNKTDINDIITAAMDAAMVTSPNIAIPAVLTSYVNNEVTDVLYNPRNATKIAKEVKIGDWTTTTWWNIFLCYKSYKISGCYLQCNKI